MKASCSTKKQFNDSVKHIEDGYNPGASIGYFITDDVSVNLNYDTTNHTRSNDGTGNQKIKGDTGSVTAQYHFGQAGVDSCVHTLKVVSVTRAVPTLLLTATLVVTSRLWLSLALA